MTSAEAVLEATQFVVLVEKVCYPEMNEALQYLHHQTGQAYWAIVGRRMLIALFKHWGHVGSSPVPWYDVIGKVQSSCAYVHKLRHISKVKFGGSGEK